MEISTGEIVWLPIGKLNVDHRYQRHEVKSWVKHIAENFDPNAFGVLLVNRRDDGTYWVVDGQQRLGAVRDELKWDDDQKVPCILVEVGGARNEAGCFVRHNATKGIRPVDQFFARVVEGDKIALSIKDVIESVGLKISRNSQNGHVAALKACETLYCGNGSKRRGSYPWVLRDTLQTILEAWGDQREALQSVMLRSVGALIFHCPKIDRERLVNALHNRANKAGPIGLLSDAKKMAKMVGGSTSDAAVDLMVSEYNKKLRTNKLPNWRDIKAMGKR